MTVRPTFEPADLLPGCGGRLSPSRERCITGAVPRDVEALAVGVVIVTVEVERTWVREGDQVPGIADQDVVGKGSAERRRPGSLRDGRAGYLIDESIAVYIKCASSGGREIDQKLGNRRVLPDVEPECVVAPRRAAYAIAILLGRVVRSSVVVCLVVFEDAISDPSIHVV